jgi:8-oxo-dGTP diphosphatase
MLLYKYKKFSKMNYDIYKAGAIIIKDRKILFTRAKGKEFFIAPGGKLEKDETPIQALKRELMEEINISFEDSDIEEFGVFYAPAAYDLSKKLRMDVFLINRWQGEIKPSNEVEEVLWVNSKILSNIKLGSIFEHEVIPRLKEFGMID